MKKDYSKFLKNLLLGTIGSFMSLNTLPSKAAEPTRLLLDDINDGQISETDKIQELSKKLVLVPSEDGWDSFSHRSHRSHSSHRSHRSHRSHSSHYSSSSGTTSTTGSSTTTRYNSSSSTSTSSYSAPKKTSTIYKSNSITKLKLGDRVIKPNMYGSDVTQLINILLKKKYLVREDGVTVVNGLQTYEGEIINAVKEFQRLNNLPVDGIVGSQTAYKLLKK